MSQFVYPSAAELREIEQEKLPVLTQGDPIFSIMPIRNVEEYNIMWEQMDSYTGLQGLRGLDGKPAKVDSPGVTQFIMSPGVYGEFIEITEEELTTKRKLGTFGAAISLEDTVMRKQDLLLNRRLDRLRQVGWATLKGSYSVLSKTKIVSMSDAWQVQKYVRVAAWTDYPNAVILVDFRNVQLLGRGRSCSFRSDASAYMNQVTLNAMLQNRNTNDLAGRRTTGLNSLLALTLSEINTILQGETLPQIVVYDEGYLDETQLNAAGKPLFVPFIPDGAVLVVGKRRGATPGEYQMVRNANNPDLQPGPYTKVFDTMDREVPRRIEVHDGHNGGPSLLYPGDIVYMQVF